MADRRALLAELLGDLADESAALDALVADLEETAWLGSTPAEGWTVAHQIAHLAWTDQQAVLAATDPEGFRRAAAAAGPRLGAQVDDAAASGATEEPTRLLARWREGREALSVALAALPDGAQLPWFGPPMSAASMASARLMETWAHGLDVTDGLRRPPSVSGRLRHVAHIGVRTRDFAFGQRGLPVPAEPFRVELTAPGGTTWAWGPEEAGQRVTGPALDFCFLVTRRRHRDDLALEATGPDADRWLDVAQAFAGPPGEGRPATGAAAPGTSACRRRSGGQPGPRRGHRGEGRGCPGRPHRRHPGGRPGDSGAGPARRGLPDGSRWISCPTVPGGRAPRPAAARRLG